MNTQSRVNKIQGVLDRLTRKWWLYILFLLLFFLPSYAEQSYDPRQSSDLVGEVLSNPIINTSPILGPVAKLIPIILIAAVFISGNKARRLFNFYVAILYIAIALFQNSAITESHGLVVLTGNLMLILVVSLVWIWEVAAERNDFSTRKIPLWKWWVAPVVLLPFLAPVNSTSLSPDFNLAGMLTNSSGLTYCFMTPVILAVLSLFHPTVNLPVLRVSSYVGILFGAINMLMWFVMEPLGWWMGVLHIPLVVLSIYTFMLSLRINKRESSFAINGVI
jgi:hypothetical protein